MLPALLGMLPALHPVASAAGAPAFSPGPTHHKAVALTVTDGLDGRVTSMKVEPRNFVFRYHSPAHFVDVFKTYYGPMLKAFAALDEQGRLSLAADLHALIHRFNRTDDGTVLVPGEYLEVVIVKE